MVTDNEYLLQLDAKMALAKIIRELEAERDKLKAENKNLRCLKEFARLVKDCPPGELHLLPLAADALLSELGE